MQEIFKGAGVAIVTPMNDDLSVNYDKLEELVEFHVQNHTDAIVICGTTGESATLTMEEHRDVIAACVRFAKGRIPVVAGTGSNDTRAAVQLSSEAEEDGADGLLVVTPYYNKATQAGLKKHYAMIAGATKLPIIAYNIPSRTGVLIQPQTMADIFNENENIIGVKEATGDFAVASKMMQLTDGKMHLYSGEDGLVIPLFAIGGKGVISVVSNVAPQWTHDMCQAYFDGDHDKALKMQLDSLNLVEALFSEVNPIPVKVALNLMGKEVGPLRPPLFDMEEANKAKLKAELERFGLL